MYDPDWIGRQAMRADADITEAQLAELVSHFYGKVRRDPELGPVFNGAISDWDTHLEKLTAFWSSVMLGTGRYRGQPMVAHMQLGPAITPALFDRWLHLWGDRKSVVEGKSVSVRVDLGGRRIIKKTNKK